MRANGTEEQAHVYACVGVHTGVEITVSLDQRGGIGAEMQIGGDYSSLTMDFADVESLDRLSAVAADGARQLRGRITANETDRTSEHG